MLKKLDYPILEFDNKSEPIVTAEAYNVYDEIGLRTNVKRCLLTFFPDVVGRLEGDFRLTQAFRMRMEGVRPRVYTMKVGDEFIYVLPMPIGAPQAARCMEMLGALGVSKFMVCGGGGTLDNKKTQNKVLVLDEAVRDEGTSYHYLPPARSVKINPEVLAKIEATLKAEAVNYIRCKTWTTDAIFRETKDKVALRKSEGCDVVEMECSAFYAVAEHKGMLCGQLLYAGDVVCQDEGWDHRDWHNKKDRRVELFDLAIKCLMVL